MNDDSALSYPITLRIPGDILSQLEEIASDCKKSRSWIMVRAFKAYLASEGKDLLEIAQARRDIAAGNFEDFDQVMDEVDDIISGDAA